VLPETQAAVSVRGVVRRFGSKLALGGVDLDVSPGEIHALLGPNGAGKTTLTRIICGLVDAEVGSIHRRGTVGLVPSGDRTFYLRLSGRENLIFFGRLNGLRAREAKRRAAELLDAVGLAEAAKMPVGRFSHGMQKRLSVARALLANPSLLLVDEATHDLDPAGAAQVRVLVEQLAKHGTAVLWTTQRVEEIRGFAQNVSFLHNGRICFVGTVAELIARAPSPRYAVSIRNGNPARPPDAEWLQRTLGTAACISEGPDGSGHFLLEPAPSHAFGSVIARLAAAGYVVTACRQERAEIETAFLALTAEAAS
jgi:ABC-type multidrug transport system ATPase subunit